MLVPSCWLTSLLFIASATAHATSLTSIYPHADLKRRYLSTGTTVSLPSAATPPYPTGSANGTSVPTGSIYPSGVSSTAGTSTAVPAPTPSAFYLVIADTGTPLRRPIPLLGLGSRRHLSDKALSPFQQRSGSVFSLSANGTLWLDGTGPVASYFTGYPGFHL